MREIKNNRVDQSELHKNEKYMNVIVLVCEFYETIFGKI